MRIGSLIGVLLATLFIVSIVALAIPIHSSVTIENVGQWETLANAPATWGSNNGHRIEAMGNYIYFWVGDSGNGFYRYDPSDLSWHSLATAPFTSSYAVGMVAAKDSAGHPAIYIIGGSTSANSQKWYRYTEYNNSWSGLLSTSIPWTGSGAQTNCNKPANGSEFVWDGGNIIYYFPGSGYSYNRYDWYEYTISTNTWTYINEFNSSGDPKNGPGNSACLVTIGSEKYIYIQFGHTPSGKYESAKFMRYQISTGSWWTPAQTGYGADDGADLVWDGGDNLYLFPGAYEEASSGAIDEYRFLCYSISKNTWVALPDMPSPGGQGNGNDDGGAAGIVGNYIYKLKGNDTNGDTASTLFYRYQFRNSSTPTATATGPTGSTNNPSVSITYTYTLTPTSVKLYYTKNGGTSWTLAGEDTSVDGTFAYNITSGDGTYGWIAVAIGGGSTETDPPAGGTSPEAASLILDTTPPTSSVDAISSYWKTSTSFTVTASASDALSGLNRVALWYRYSSDNLSWGAWTWFDNDTASPWSWTFTSPSGNGYYQFYSTARDNAGNEEAAPGAADTICGVDNTPPTSSVNAISPYWQISTSFTATAVASDALSGVARVALWYRYSSDNSGWGSWTWFDNDNTSPFSWTFTSPNGNGYYQFYSRARDNAGNEEAAPGAADAICGVDNIPPTSSINAILPYWQTSTSFTVTASANDSLSGVARVALWYRYSSDNLSWGAWTWFDNDTASPWSWTFTSPSGNGYYQFYSTARDNAGNEEAAPGVADAICGVDNILPTSSVNTISSYWQISTSFTVTASANDALSGLAKVALWYRYSSDNSSWGSWTWFDNDSTSPWSWTFTSPNGNGYYQFYSRARDNAGNEETAPATADTICGVDNNSPTSSVNTISPYWQTSTSFTVTASASDALSDVNRVAIWYRYSGDNSSWGSWTWFDNDNTSPWSWTFTSPNGNGYYQFYSTARDNAGNEEAAPVAADTICGVDNAPPNAPLLIEPENGMIIGDNTPTFRWTAVTDLSSPVTYTLQVDNDSNFSSPEVNVLGLIDNAYTPIAELADGTYYWHVRAVDNAGNVGDNSAYCSFRIDVTPPGKPTLVSPDNNSTTTDNTPTFKWTAITDPSGLTYTLVVDNEAGFTSPYIYYKISISENQHTCENELAAGTYYWRVRAVDNVGNEGEWADNFKLTILNLPTLPGKPAIVSPANNVTTSDNTPTFVWTRGSNADNHRIEVDNDSNFSSPIDNVVVASPNDNTWTKPSPGYANGTYYWRVWAKNVYGENVSENTWQFTVESPTWINTGDLENARHVYSLLYASDGAVYAGTASGDDPWDSVGVVFKTTDGGTTWVPTASLGGLGVVGNIEAMIQARGGTIDNNILIGTAWEGKIFKTTNGGNNWIEVVDLTGVVEVDSLIQAANGDLYAGTHYSSGAIDEARIYRSTNYGESWQVVAASSIDGELSGCTTVECLIQASTGYFYCGTQPGHVWRSDNGDNWYKVGDKDINFGGSYKMYSLLDASNGYIYAASRNPGNVYRSTDNGNTWTEVANGITELGGATRTDGLCQASNGMIYVGTDVGKIYRTADGDNWVLEANLPADRVNAIIEANLGWMYAGTSYNGDVFTTYISPAIPWTGMATFRLENLYKVSLEKDLQINTGSKLVVKFYKYDNVTLQANSVIDSIMPPQSVVENENVPHPRVAEGFSWGTVQIAKLVLTTGNENEVISTIASFTVHQSDLRIRYGNILRAWGDQPEQQSAFRAEIGDILRQWSSAPV